MPLVGVNHRQPILHMSMIMVHFYYIDETMNQFEIGYMINPSINCDKAFREKVEKFLNSTFNSRTMETFTDFLKNKNTCIMELIMFYGNNGIKPKKLYRSLSCVIFLIINNYVCIDYI